MKISCKNPLLTSSLAILAMAATQVHATVIAVPNGSFETLYKPGSTTITAQIGAGGPAGDGWTHGAGAGAVLEFDNAAAPSALATYSDSTTGSAVDIPGWINATGWTATYDWASGGSGSISRQNAASPYGEYFYMTNGSDYSNPNGGAIQSANDLGMISGGESYTISMNANGSSTLLFLQILANGVAITPSSTVDPGGAWRTVSSTYDAASLASYTGQALTIRVGWEMGSAGTQSMLDNVTLTSIPEPTSLSLLALGALGLVRRKRG